MYAEVRITPDAQAKTLYIFMACSKLVSEVCVVIFAFKCASLSYESLLMTNNSLP